MNLTQQYELSAAITERLTSVVPEWMATYTYGGQTQCFPGCESTHLPSVDLPCMKDKHGEYQPITNACTPDGMMELIEAMGEKLNIAVLLGEGKTYAALRYNVKGINHDEFHVGVREKTYFGATQWDLTGSNLIVADTLPEAVALAAKAALEAMT